MVPQSAPSAPSAPHRHCHHAPTTVPTTTTAPTGRGPGELVRAASTTGQRLPKRLHRCPKPGVMVQEASADVGRDRSSPLPSRCPLVAQIGVLSRYHVLRLGASGMRKDEQCRIVARAAAGCFETRCPFPWISLFDIGAAPITVSTVAELAIVVGSAICFLAVSSSPCSAPWRNVGCRWSERQGRRAWPRSACAPSRS